jgi:hypothetical protein
MATVADWWWEYLQVLRNAHRGTVSHAKLNALTADLEQQGIIKPGVPMPRNGAEGLAFQCDEILKKVRLGQESS